MAAFPPKGGKRRARSNRKGKSAPQILRKERFKEGLDLTERSVSSRGTRASTCHQSKDAKFFLKEILTGQASSLILSGLRQGWSRWSQSCFKNERAF